MAELNTFEDKKEEYVHRYEIRLELAKLEQTHSRVMILRQTLGCLENTRSSWEIEACLSNERKRVLEKTNYQNLEDNPTFYIARKALLYKYEIRIQQTNINKKKFILTKTKECVQRAKSYDNIEQCKDFENDNLSSMIQSYEDNPRLKNILQKDELIQRYEIRIETARIDRMYDRVTLFSKTLNCFKNSNSEDEIKQCKKDEKKEIIYLIKS